jgi:hypothetical protein
MVLIGSSFEVYGLPLSPSLPPPSINFFFRPFNVKLTNVSSGVPRHFYGRELR